MPKTRVEQLKETIVSLRIRGLADRKELNAVRHQLKQAKAALKAAQLEIEALKEPVLKYADEIAPVCTTAAQYEALSVRRAGVKP